MKEYKELTVDAPFEDECCTVQPKNDDYFAWQATITGPVSNTQHSPDRRMPYSLHQHSSSPAINSPLLSVARCVDWASPAPRTRMVCSLLTSTCRTTIPSSRPKLRFTTTIYHANISEKGEICLDSIKDKWCTHTTHSHTHSLAHSLAQLMPYSTHT